MHIAHFGKAVDVVRFCSEWGGAKQTRGWGRLKNFVSFLDVDVDRGAKGECLFSPAYPASSSVGGPGSPTLPSLPLYVEECSPADLISGHRSSALSSSLALLSTTTY